jgi:hypothetical protein
VDYWFGNGWGYSVEDFGDTVAMHVRSMPTVLLMHRLT